MNLPHKLVPLIPRVIKKVWGEERIFEDSAGLYIKKLVYLAGGKSSLHMHVSKTEYFFVSEGVFNLRWFEAESGEEHQDTLYEGQIILIKPGFAHELFAPLGGTIVEFSTRDDPEDSYRLNKSELRA